MTKRTEPGSPTRPDPVEVFAVSTDNIARESNGQVGQAPLGQRQFFELIFGGLEGYLCVAGKRPGGKFTEWFYRYPAELDAALRELRRYRDSNNLYYCAHLLTKSKRVKGNAAMVRALWADGRAPAFFRYVRLVR